jgi:RNA polymerase sigma factor (sigma-70 family)
MSERELKTRLSLIERLRDRDDRVSWREFFDRYWPLIYGLAIKSGLSEQEAEEVVQETLVTISRSLDGYEYRPQECSFKSWMFKMARWRIIDQFRKRAPDFVVSGATRDSEQTAIIERIPEKGGSELERIWDEEWEQNLMSAAVARVKEKVSIREFQIFDLYVLKGWAVSEVRKMLHVSATHVYVAKHRVSGLIRAEVRKLERELS